jgi:hypothetical protein
LLGLELTTGALAVENEVRGGETASGVLVPALVVPLAGDRVSFRIETEPGQVVEDRLFVLRAVPPPVVVLEPDDHLSTEGPGHSPDVHGVHRVSEVEVSGHAGRETGPERGWAEGATVGQVGGHPGNLVSPFY